MRRLLGFFILAALVALGVAWIANRQGEMVFTLDGYRVAMSAGAAIGAAVLFALLAIFAARLLGVVAAGPGALGRWSKGRREQRGQLALSRGLVAAAAGDAAEARRQARKAQSGIGGSPLGLLLTAQTANLEGDHEEQRAAYRAMLEHPETEFLGLRGLFMEAMRREDSDEAMRLASRAHALKPRAAWAANALFDLKSANREWAEAKEVLENAQRARLMEPDVARRRRAVLLAAEALDAEGENPDRALTLAQQALDLSPGLAPAAALAARKLAAGGKLWRAQDVIEAAWAQSPHPDLAAAYDAIKPESDDKARAERLIGLAHLKRDHFESRMLEAEQQMNLGNWPEARRVLAPLAKGFASARVCTLMAEIEQGQRHDAAAAHSWLARAVRAPRDAEWRCQACGWTSPSWQAVCGKCGAFDSLSWSAPGTMQLEHYAAEPDYEPDLHEDADDDGLGPTMIEADAGEDEEPAPTPPPSAPVDRPPAKPAAKPRAAESGGARSGYVILPRAPDDPGPAGEDYAQEPADKDPFG